LVLRFSPSKVNEMRVNSPNNIRELFRKIRSMPSVNKWDLNPEEKELLFRYFPRGVIALDLETTGLSPLVDKIIEISAIKITPEGIEIFDQLIDPEIEIPPHTIVIHQITDDMVKGKPKIQDILPDFKIFMEDIPLIAHNSKFDLGFIMFDWKRLNLPGSNNDIYCSCKLARSLIESPNHKLSTLVQVLGIPLENHHRGIDDSYASLKLLIKCLEAYEEEATSAPDLKELGHLFNLVEFDHFDELPEHLSMLTKKVQFQQVVEIKYKGGQLKNQFRPVKAMSLLNTPEGNILYAHCLISDMHKSFHLKKITELREPGAEDIARWYKELSENRQDNHRKILAEDEEEKN